MTTSEPSWQRLLFNHMDAKATAPRRQLSLNFPDQFAGNILEAARGRNLSLTAFARRSVMAMAVHDTGADWFELMRFEPRLRGYDQKSTRFMDPCGHGFGDWKIERLGSYDDA